MTCPLKRQLLGDRAPKALKLGHGAQLLCRKFQNPYIRTIVVLCMGYNLGGRNVTSAQYPRCSIQQTAIFPQLGMVLTFGIKTLQILDRSAIPLCDHRVPLRNSNSIYVRLFEHFFDGLGHRAICAVILGQN